MVGVVFCFFFKVVGGRTHICLEHSNCFSLTFVSFDVIMAVPTVCVEICDFSLPACLSDIVGGHVCLFLGHFYCFLLPIVLFDIIVVVSALLDSSCF